MGAKDLLSALVAFLQPLIQGQASTKANDQNYHSGVEAISGSDGKNLLSALTTFVKAVVNSPPEVHIEQEGLSKPGVAVDEDRISEVPRDLPTEVARSELETMTLSAARAHVFNKMPIRLLAFDKDGSNIKLIGRNDIFSCILPDVLANIAKPKFQEEWAAAGALRDIQDAANAAMQYRQNKLKELLRGAVEQSVHYAILSHTWMRDTPGEITFNDWAMREHNPRGNTKITRFCEVAAQNHNITLGWIDSICINKDSSSELDESIRSMFNWYRGAAVCITYLSMTASIPDAHGDSWFTRGWTLQELLAPVHSVFYNKNWTQLGSSNDAEIQLFIVKACGITGRELELSWRGTIEAIPLSRRMQMACGRQVTREEDTSYSLMGILGVDIPIAYGEGARRAFFRLVRELFNTKKYVVDLFNRAYNYDESLLPSSLESYRHRSDVWDYSAEGSYLDKYLPLDPIISTHLGMHIPLLLVPGLVADIVDDENYVAKGALSAKMQISIFFPAGHGGTFKSKLLSLLMCDSRLYTGDLANLANTNHAALPDGTNCIYMAGIVNFGTDNSGNILLPEFCLALKVDWVGVEDGIFTPSGYVSILPGVVHSFKLESKKGFEIPKVELEEHGIQLVSLYL